MRRNKPNAYALYSKYQSQEYQNNQRNYCTEISDPKAMPCRKLSRCLSNNKLEFKTNNLCYNP